MPTTDVRITPPFGAMSRPLLSQHSKATCKITQNIVHTSLGTSLIHLLGPEVFKIIITIMISCTAPYLQGDLSALKITNRYLQLKRRGGQNPHKTTSHLSKHSFRLFPKLKYKIITDSDNANTKSVRKFTIASPPKCTHTHAYRLCRQN